MVPEKGSQYVAPCYNFQEKTPMMLYYNPREISALSDMCSVLMSNSYNYIIISHATYPCTGISVGYFGDYYALCHCLIIYVPHLNGGEI